MTHILDNLYRQLRASRALRERLDAVSGAATPAYRAELEAIFQRDAERESI